MASESALTEWSCDTNDEYPGYVELTFTEVTDEGAEIATYYFEPQDALELAEALRVSAQEAM